MSSSIDRAKNPPRPPYRPVVATSRSFDDDLHELWAGGQWQGEYDATTFAAAFRHIGRQMVLRSLTDEEIAALGLRVMVSFEGGEDSYMVRINARDMLLREATDLIAAFLGPEQLPAQQRSNRKAAGAFLRQYEALQTPSP